MSNTLAAPRAPIRRRLLGVALVAAVGAGGVGVTVAATHDDSSGSAPTAAMVHNNGDGTCWYTGLFEEGGHWYKGLFRERC